MPWAYKDFSLTSCRGNSQRHVQAVLFRQDPAGSLKKYPVFKVNGMPGFKVKEIYCDLLLNDSKAITTSKITFAPRSTSYSYLADDTETLGIDPNPVITG